MPALFCLRLAIFSCDTCATAFTEGGEFAHTGGASAALQCVPTLMQHDFFLMGTSLREANLRVVRIVPNKLE